MSNEHTLLNNLGLHTRTSIYDFSTSQNEVTDAMLRVLDMELLRMGYVLSTDTKESLKGFSREAFNETVDTLYMFVTESVGAGVYHEALFKDFPRIIPTSKKVNHVNSELNARLLSVFAGIEDMYGKDSSVITDSNIITLECGHRVCGYLPHDTCPVCTHSAKTVKIHNMHSEELFFNPSKQPKSIGLVDKDELHNVVRSLLMSKSGLSEHHKTVLTPYLDSLSKEELQKVLPEVVPFKETVSYLVGVINAHHRDSAYELCSIYVKTANDVLRVAESLNEYDDHSHGFKLSNQKRKLLVKLLNDVKNPEEDMFGERNKWVSLNMAVHFGTFKKKYPAMFQSVDRVLNRPETITTFNSLLEKAIGELDINRVLELSSGRPSILGRNLDHYVRKFPESTDQIIDCLVNCGDHISMRVLITARNNFMSRLAGYEGQRMFANKKGFVQSIEGVRPPIEVGTCEKVIAAIDTVIKNKLKDEDNHGKRVWVDKDLYRFKVPMKMRSMKNTMNKAERGSHMDYSNDDNDIIRMFIYWKENATSGRVDLDLSAQVCDRNFNELGTCSYYSLHSDVMNMVHSGDITSAPNGASEFIDADLRDKEDAKYVLMYVNVYSEQKLDEFEAFCGVMFLNGSDTDKLYHPEKVRERFELTSDSTSVLCFVYDLDSNQMIWADMGGHTSSAHNIGTQANDITNKVEYLINERDTAISMGQYFKLYVEANNMQVVDKKEDAEVVFDNSLVRNTDEFNSKWLA